MIRTIEILRIEKSEEGVFGVLKVNSRFCCVTLERPWLFNQPDISCIPDGMYQCKRVDSPAFGNTFEIINVPGRSKILFHAGNFVSDSKGCILLGEGIGEIEGQRAIKSSKAAVKTFMEAVQYENYFPINIRSV